jgi:hypothetical protein
MFINNLETGLKREMGVFFDSDYAFDEDRETLEYKLISLKEHPIWEN